MKVSTDTLVVGSGPGGAMTAALLAEAGVDVVLVEEGEKHPIDARQDHSLAQMDQKWRSGGLTVALGSPKVSYVEGRCLGGASESNAGLYHPPIDAVLDGWASRFGISDFGAEVLGPHLDAVVEQIGVSKRPDGFSPASDRLAEGAEAMGWR